MARKKLPEEPENHERWLVSYADFITLLFAFFVVMYSISSVNDGKYRVLSDALVSAFSTAQRDLEPIQIDELTPAGSSGLLDGGMSLGPVEQETSSASQTPNALELATDAEAMRFMMDEIARTLSTYIDRELVDVAQGDAWVEVEVRSSLLFTSGSARLSREAVSVLKTIAAILQPLSNPIHVEGFTDNVPIDTFAYPSNWELSAARAASVVHLFSRLGIDPKRMAATGYAEFRPIAENDTEAGRNKNRRVVLVILAGHDTRKTLEQRDAQRLQGQPGSRDASDGGTTVGGGP